MKPSVPPQASTPLKADRMAALLSEQLGPAATQRIGTAIEVLESTASTNDEALQRAQQGAEEGLVIFAEHQSQGRGRRGDLWHSPPRQDLLFSVLLRPTLPLAVWCRLSHLAALALCQAIEAQTELRPRIKWPNDLYLNDHKLAGLLVETRTATPASPSAFAVVGIGLNVNTRVFPDSLEVPATSLALASDLPHLDRDKIAAAVLGALNGLYPEALTNFEPLRHGVSERSYLLNRQVRVESGQEVYWGTVTGLGPNGELCLRSTETGESLSLHSADRVRLTRLDL